MLIQINENIVDEICIRFDSRSEFSLADGSMGKNVIIFRADMSSSLYIDNKNKDILILSKRPTQELHDITLTAKVKYPINFTQSRKRLVLSLHFNGSTYLSTLLQAYTYLLMLQKYINSKKMTLK